MKLASAALLLAACGDNVHPQPDAPPDPGFVEATPATLPQLVKLDGDVLAAPKVQPIFFAGDDAIQAMVEDFAGKLAGSAYWTAATKEYGVGDLTVLPTLVVTDPAPTTDAKVQAFLAAQLDGTHAGWTYDANTIYSVFLPPGVVLTDPDGSKSCVDYSAYHDEAMGAGGKSIVYALLPRCQVQGPQIDDVTASASHEWIEAATDPRVETTPAFGDADVEHYIWAYTPGAEVSDYCEYLDAAYQPLVGNYVVQRSYSNEAARAGKDPCVPALDAPYVAAYPVLDDDVTIDGFTGPVKTKSVKVALGTPRTIDVVLYSDRPTDEFRVDAIDTAKDFGGPAELSFSWDRTLGKNGDTLKLTITRLRNGDFGGSEFAIVATTGSTPSNIWWSLAAN